MVDGSLTNRFVSSAGKRFMIRVDEPSGNRRTAIASLCAALLVAAAAFLTGAQELDAAGEIEARQADPKQSRAEYERSAARSRCRPSALATAGRRDRGIKKDHATHHRGADPVRQDGAKLGEDIEDITGKLEDLKERQEEDPRSRWSPGATCWPKCWGRCSAWASTRRRRCWSSRRTRCRRCAAPSCSAPWCPELREQTEVLLADLKELSRVTASIEAERARLTATVEEQVGEKKRLSLLLDEKKKLQDEQRGRARRRKRRRPRNWPPRPAA